MIKNLPTTCSIESVKELIDAQGFKGNYDFLYLPMKFISMSPFGYAFVCLGRAQEAYMRFRVGKRAVSMGISYDFEVK